MEFCGADFAWGSRAWAGQPGDTPGDSDSSAPEGTSTPSQPASALAPASKTWDIEAGGGSVVSKTATDTKTPGASSNSGGARDQRSQQDSQYTAPLTLHGPLLSVSPGEFVGIAGEVCIFR